MTIQEALNDTLAVLNLVEVRGEKNIAALSRAIAHLKGIARAFEQAGAEETQEKTKE